MFIKIEKRKRFYHSWILISKENSYSHVLFIYMFITLPILKDPSNKALQKQSVRHGTPTNSSKIYPTITKFKIYATFRNKGKKQSSNFLARYKYGNGREKGIKNMHVNIRSLKYKIQEVKILFKSTHHTFLGYQKQN